MCTRFSTQVPSPDPGAPPIMLSVLRFIPGKGKWGEGRAQKEWQLLRTAQMAGLAVALRCRLTRDAGYRGAAGMGLGRC